MKTATTTSKTVKKPVVARRTSVTAKPGKTAALKHAVGKAIKFYVMIEGARPSAGNRLAAHTDAALRFLNMANQEPARKQAVVSLFGARAVQYHENNGHFEQKNGMVNLTKKGFNFFKGRFEDGKVDADLSNAFLTAIQKGAASTPHGIKATHLTAVEMPVH